jgi:glycosyltransferase involved in cell wall biosynthesis
MVPITIGVPVYNGADLLDESLACLARQTFGDFKVLIYDNASTDGTAEIARSWAARDARFVHFRHATNIPVLANYLAVVQAAESPWFMWRADDDLSDDNYLEVLYSLAVGAPGCELAVATVLSCDLDGGRRRIASPPRIADPTSLVGRLRMLFGSHPGWFYGLWRTPKIQDAYVDVCANFPFAFAADHAAIYGPIVDGAVRATTDTRFIQRFRRTAATPRRQTRMPFSLMLETRGVLRRQLRRVRAVRDLPPSLRVVLVAVEPFYLQRALPKVQKMVRTLLREWLGIAGKGGSIGRHFERASQSAVIGAQPNRDRASPNGD